MSSTGSSDNSKHIRRPSIPTNPRAKKQRINSDCDSDSSLDINTVTPHSNHPGGPHRRNSPPLSERPWSIHPSTTRLRRIEELNHEIEESEARSIELLRFLKEESRKRRRLQSQIEDLTETQLQEQLAGILHNFHSTLSDQGPFPGCPSYTGHCLDQRGISIHFQDLVEVETGFSSTRAIGRVVQTEANNIVLVRISCTGFVIGTFGNRLRIVGDPPSNQNSQTED